MDIRIIILILALAAVAVLLVAIMAVQVSLRKRRSAQLREKFGPEYDYAMQVTGDKRAAEVALQEREKRVKELVIQPLSPDHLAQYKEEWNEIQADFVDRPAKSVEKADKLITEVMVARGFPVEDFDQRAEDISVLYPQFVNDYRRAHSIAQASQDNGASTEDLRQAMIYDRSLFEVLLESDGVTEKVAVN